MSAQWKCELVSLKIENMLVAQMRKLWKWSLCQN